MSGAALAYGLVEDRDTPGLGEESTATFSPCRTYRYALTRRWAHGPLAAFVMLNPSTADAFILDPTVRRCIGFARRWNAGGVLVLNLFALRSTDPKALYRHEDPVGPANDDVIAGWLASGEVDRVVAAWGAHGVLNGRAGQVASRLRTSGAEPVCLGVTKDSHPRHPLYVRGDTAAIPLPSTGTDPTDRQETPA
jgi:hypothetical protein